MEIFTKYFGEPTAYNIITQLIGIIALSISLLSYQQKDYKKMRLLLILCGVPFTVHFLMLRAYTGFILNLISLLRATVYYFKDEKKWASSRLWIPAFLAAFAVSIFFTWQSAWDLLPLCGCILHTFVLSINSTKVARLAIWPSSLGWLIYNTIYGSFAGVLTEILNLCSIIIGIIRHDIRRKSKQNV